MTTSNSNSNTNSNSDELKGRMEEFVRLRLDVESFKEKVVKYLDVLFPPENKEGKETKEDNEQKEIMILKWCAMRQLMQDKEMTSCIVDIQCPEKVAIQSELLSVVKDAVQPFKSYSFVSFMDIMKQVFQEQISSRVTHPPNVAFIVNVFFQTYRTKGKPPLFVLRLFNEASPGDYFVRQNGNQLHCDYCDTIISGGGCHIISNINSRMDVCIICYRTIGIHFNLSKQDVFFIHRSFSNSVHNTILQSVTNTIPTQATTLAQNNDGAFAIATKKLSHNNEFSLSLERSSDNWEPISLKLTIIGGKDREGQEIAQEGQDVLKRWKKE